MTEQNEMSAGDACARVAVLEAELAELRNGYMRMRNVAAGYSNLCDADSANARRLEKEFEAVDQAHYRAAPAPVEPFQRRVQAWMLECFGQAIAADRAERNHRFLEEALELVQSLGCSADEAHRLVGYVYGRPTGEPTQEVGGVMVTLAALCLANGLDMAGAGEQELARINQPDTLLRIREKQRNKPAMSPLPGVYPERAAPVERVEQDDWRSWRVGEPLIYQPDEGDEGFVHASLTPGNEYAVHEVADEHETMVVLDDDGDELGVLVGEFVRAPQPAAPAPDVAGLVSRIQDAAQAWYENTDDGLSKLLEVIEAAAHQRKEGD